MEKNIKKRIYIYVCVYIYICIYIYIYIHPLEESTATHSSIFAWRIPWTESLVGYSPQGHKESDTTKVTKHTHTDIYIYIKLNHLATSQVALVVKNIPANAGDRRDMCSIPGSGRSPG